MNNYNFLQKQLHLITLGNRLIKKSLFEIEKNIFLKKDNLNNSEHIFITGLPRSGTTSLLNFFIQQVSTPLSLMVICLLY